MERLEREQWWLLIYLLISNYASGLSISLQAPFYPEVAVRKNVAASEYGLVFASYDFTALVASPILGRYWNKIGVKFLNVCSLLGLSVSAISFGLLIHVTNSTIFVFLSCLLRGVEGIATVGLIISSQVTLRSNFDSKSTVSAIFIQSFSIGMLCGPALGGFLYQIGGFSLPFSLVGCTHFLCFLVAFRLFNAAHSLPKEDSYENFLSVFKNPYVTWYVWARMATTITRGILYVSLNVHLSPLKLSPGNFGFVFSIIPLSAILFTPLIGYMIDKSASPPILVIAGCIFGMTALVLIGPLPWIPLQVTLPLVIPGFICFGLLLSIMSIASLEGLQQSVVGDSGVATGLHTFSIFSGELVGSILGGIFLDYIGFRIGTLIPLTLMISVIATLGIGYTFSCCKKRSKCSYNVNSE